MASSTAGLLLLLLLLLPLPLLLLLLLPLPLLLLLLLLLPAAVTALQTAIKAVDEPPMTLGGTSCWNSAPMTKP